MKATTWKSMETVLSGDRLEKKLKKSFIRITFSNNLIIDLVLVFVSSAVIITIYEYTKSYTFPDLNSRESHIVTILFISVLFTIVAYFVRRKQTVLYQELEHENHVRRLAEKKLRLLNQKQQELIATRDKIFSIIAHDLRNPLGGISGLSGLLNDKMQSVDSEESKEFIMQINITANQTLKMLDDLLEWAKVQTGQIDFKPERLHLDTAIKNIIDGSTSSAIVKNIFLTQTEQDNISVYADSKMVSTILRNLISNAIKFTKPGGRVEVSARGHRNQVIITVADDGVGMDEKTQDKLFRLDTSVTTAGTANEKGTGLGLILCKEFVEKNGGKIWVESEKGKGSRFSFTLPGA